MSFSDLVREDRRLVILKLLTQSAGYSANEHLLRSALGGFGHTVSVDALRTDLAWLDEQGLIKLETLATVRVAQLSARGADVASGVATVPGVKRPEPEF